MNYTEFKHLQTFMVDDPQAASEQLFNQFTNLIGRATDCKVCINLDWLSVSFIDETGSIPEPADKDETRPITNTITLKNYGKGNEYYKYCWHVLYQGEHLASIMCYSRNEKFVKRGVLKVDFKNHLLYTATLWPFYTELVGAFGLRYKNVSRVDIAIDGLNYLMDFINLYVKQVKGKKAVEMKGRAKLNCKVFDRKLTDYQNFNLGAGRKVVTMYNKSLDIVKTGKDYIQKNWINNGVTTELLPIDYLAKAMNDEKIYLDGYENIYRFEIRLKGEMILKMKDFTIDWLKSADMLMSMVKRMNESFFEFVYYTYADTSKCQVIDLMPYHLYNTQNVALVGAKPKDDLYKTRLSIHKNVRQLYLGNLGPDDYATTQMLVFDVTNFELQNWFLKKLPEWVKDYSAIQSNKSYCTDVTNYLNDIALKFESNTEEELL